MSYDAKNRMTSETQGSSYVAGSYSYSGVSAMNVASASNGATASASSIYWAQSPASNAINGDHVGSNSHWADGTSFGYPDWIQVDFSGSKTISEIDVFGLQQNYSNPVEPTLTMTSTYALTNFEVQYWDGSAWAVVPGGSVTGNDKVWKKFTFSPLITSKIRVYVTNVAGDNHSQVVEIEAWAAAGSSQSDINWLVSDHLGTPRMIFDQTGSLANVKRHDYLPFGEELVAGQGGRAIALGYSGDAIRQKFTSKERDNETGLDYFLARYYSSTMGRFTNPDPYNPILDSEEEEDFTQYLGQPQNWNRYVYVWNNPLRYVDPFGEKVYVVTYTVGNKEGDEEFKRVAETNAAALKTAKGFDPKKDIVVLAGVKTKNDFQKVLNIAGALEQSGFGKVDQVTLVSHAGPGDGPVFEYGTQRQDQFFSNQEIGNIKVNWSEKGATAWFRGCNTANFAKRFSQIQNVTSFGHDRFTTFSSDPMEKSYTYLLSNGPLYMIGTRGSWPDRRQVPMVRYGRSKYGPPKR